MPLGRPSSAAESFPVSHGTNKPHLFVPEDERGCDSPDIIPLHGSIMPPETPYVPTLWSEEALDLQIKMRELLEMWAGADY